MLGDSGRRPSAAGARALDPRRRGAEKLLSRRLRPVCHPPVFTPTPGSPRAPRRRRQSQHPDWHPRPLPRRRRRRRRPGAPAVWGDRPFARRPGFAVQRQCAIDRIADHGGFAAARRARSSARREAPFGGGRSRGGGGAAIDVRGCEPPSIRRRRRAPPSRRARGATTRWRYRRRVHALECGVYISTESRSPAGSRASPLAPAGLLAAQHRIELCYHPACGTPKNGRASDSVARSVASMAPSPFASNAANVAPSIASGSASITSRPSALRARRTRRTRAGGAGAPRCARARDRRCPRGCGGRAGSGRARRAILELRRRRRRRGADPMRTPIPARARGYVACREKRPRIDVNFPRAERSSRPLH